MNPIVRARVILADDHGLMLEGLRRILEPEFDIVAAVTDGRALLEAAHALKPDVVIVDISMPLLNGLEATRRIAKELPAVRVLMVSMHPDPDYVRAAFDAGASGYILKRSASDDLRTGIREILAGRTYIGQNLSTSKNSEPLNLTVIRTELTPRQREVLQLIAEGKAAKEIAAILNISVKTVEFHKSSISQALGLHSMADLVRYALERGVAGTATRHVPVI